MEIRLTDRQAKAVSASILSSLFVGSWWLGAFALYSSNYESIAKSPEAMEAWKYLFTFFGVMFASVWTGVFLGTNVTGGKCVFFRGYSNEQATDLGWHALFAMALPFMFWTVVLMIASAIIANAEHGAGKTFPYWGVLWALYFAALTMSSIAMHFFLPEDDKAPDLKARAVCDYEAWQAAARRNYPAFCEDIDKTWANWGSSVT